MLKSEHSPKVGSQVHSRCRWQLLSLRRIAAGQSSCIWDIYRCNTAWLLIQMLYKAALTDWYLVGLEQLRTTVGKTFRLTINCVG